MTQTLGAGQKTMKLTRVLLLREMIIYLSVKNFSSLIPFDFVYRSRSIFPVSDIYTLQLKAQQNQENHTFPANKQLLKYVEPYLQILIRQPISTNVLG